MLFQTFGDKQPQAARTTSASTAVVVRHNKLIESKHFLSHPRYADFRKRVLETAQREINAKTDLAFDFAPVTSNRKIVAICFRIRTTAAAAPER